ncbi:MAG: long-chain-fatty-acid--CoA ligase [Thermodesulfobacteriota bacterium]|nr:MAG: long-chain-fatty-acid--CoA ligase [Thermodesulfobacteriota bacterium]
MLAKQLQHWAETQPEKIALQIRDTEGSYWSYTYKELHANCLKLKSKLKKMGYKPGDYISVYGDNSPNWVVSYIAINFLGGTVIPLDALLGAQDIYNFLEFAEVKAVIVDESHIDELEKELEDKSSEIKVIPMEPTINEPGESESIKPYKPDPDDLLAILFTSGTTGTPKGVQLSNQNVFGNVQALLSSIDVIQKDNILNILPLHHGYSSIVALFSPLWTGATVTFSESIKSTDLLASIRETGVTIFPGVPRLFELLFNEIENRVKRLPFGQKIIFNSLYKISESTWKSTNIRLGKMFFGKVHEPFGKQFRFFTSGGAKLDPKVYTGFLTLGFKIAEGYGLTETSAVATLTSPDIPNPGSAGKPLPGVDVKIENPDETGTGEICLRGPNIMRGYYKNKEATNEMIKDGWLHSGDLGHVDSDNNVFITGRAKEVIVLPSGKNIYPEDVENLYNKSSLFKEICVIAHKSASGSIKGLGVVVVPNMREVKERDVFDVRDRIRSVISMESSKLPSYMQISEVLISNTELPKTRLGKFKRNEIDKIAIQLRSGDQPKEIELKPQEIEILNKPESVRFLGRFSEITEVKGPFHPNDDLTLDLGVDSLTLAEVNALLEREFGVFIPEDEIPNVRSIGDILERLPESPTINADAISEARKENNESLEDIFDLNRNFVKRTAIRIIQLLLRFIVLIAFRSRLKDVKKIPRNRAVLICPNHQSLIDPILIYALLPGEMLEKTLFTGFGEYFSKAPLSWIVHPMRIILTGTGRTSSESIRLASEGLNQGYSVCIFPEGERTSSGTIMKPRIGAGLLSVETDTPIVPIYIEGATKTLSPINPGLSFPNVRVTVMETIEPAKGDKEPRELYQDTVDEWLAAMEEIET